MDGSRCTVTYWVFAVRYWQSARWRHFIDAAVSSPAALSSVRPHSCVFSIAFISSHPVSHLSLSLLSTQSPSLSLVCMCAYEPITGTEKPQIVHSKWSKDLMNFLCCFMALRGLHGVMGFIWDLRDTAENWKTSAFHGTMVLIVTALSPWRGPEWVTHELSLFFVFASSVPWWREEHLLLLSCSRTSSCYFKRHEHCARPNQLHSFGCKSQNNILETERLVFMHLIYEKITSAFLFEEKHWSTSLIDFLRACQLADLQSWHQRPCPIGLLLKYSINPLRAAAQGQGEITLVLKKT